MNTENDLRMQNTRLRKEIRAMQESLERKNLTLDALHYVWCSGGCSTGVHRYDGVEVTEALVLEAEHNTKRLREWFESFQRRKNGS